MATPYAVDDILNSRQLGENIVDWEFDHDIQQWRVTISSHAGKMTPPPLTTFGLMATAHIGAMNEADKRRSDKAASLRMASFVGSCLDAINNEIWQICATLMQEGCEHYENTLLQQPAAEATRRIAIKAAEDAASADVAEALRLWANGEGQTAVEEAVSLYRPMVRLAHTNVPVDPDRIPDYERDLHYNDKQGRESELDTVLTLTFLALTSSKAAALWNKVIFYTEMKEASKLFAELANDPSPFGWPEAGTDDFFSKKQNLLYYMSAIPTIELRATPSVETESDVVVLHMKGTHNSPYYSIGTASYAFVQALIVAVHALHFSKMTALKEGHTPKRPRNASGGQAVYGIDQDSILETLRENFSGWHHARCLEPRQTAHACVANKLADKALVYFHGKGAVKKSQNEHLFTVYNMCLSLSNPQIVKHPHVYVQGPGNNAVPTLCEAPEYIMKTDSFSSLESELVNRLDGALQDLLRVVPPSSLAQRLRANTLTGTALSVESLVNTFGADAKCLGTVLRELHTFDSVRADAGKRYRHRLGVNASAVGLASALRHLLLAPCREV